MKEKILLSFLLVAALKVSAQNPLFLQQATSGAGTQNVSQVISTNTGKTFYNTVDYSNLFDSTKWGLYASDGTPAGTKKLPLKDGHFISTDATMLTAFGDNKILFAGDNSQGYGEVWVSDGTNAGTYGLQNFVVSGAVTPVFGIAAINDKAIYLAVSNDEHLRLHATAATAFNDTTSIYDFGELSSPYNGPFNFKTINNVTYFALNNTVTLHTEMWRTNGTSGGTYLVKDMGLDYGIASDFMSCNNNIYFTTVSSTYGDYIWQSDGTTTGTIKLKQLSTTFNQNNTYPSYAAAGTILYFTADNGVNGKEVWRTDGTTNGTYILADIVAGAAGSDPSSLAVANNILYFAANNLTNGKELWKYDINSGSGAQMVKDILPGAGSSNVSGITAVNNSIIFSATGNAADGAELWVSGGSAASTFEMANIDKSGTTGSNPSLFSVQQNKNVFFIGKYDVNGDLLNNEQCLFKYTAPDKIWTGNINSDATNIDNWFPQGVPQQTDNVIIPVNPTNNINSPFLFLNDLTVNGSSINVNSGLLFINGNFYNDGTVDNSKGGIVAISGGGITIPHYISNTGTYLGQLTASSATQLVLKSNFVLPHFRCDGLVYVYTGVYDLTIDAFDLIIPKIITDSTGKLYMPVSTSTGYFPVAADSSSFNPVYITNFGTADYFGASVKTGVYSGGEIGAGSKITEQSVNKTWFINKQTAGAANTAVALQWTATDELPSFDRSDVYLAHYTNGAWDNGTAAAANGTNPYQITRIGITDFSPFTVTSSATILPLQLFNFTATKSNGSVQLTWMTQNEINTSSFNVQRSIDGVHFNNIGSKKAMGNTSAIVAYNYVDADIAKLNVAKIYYRIETVDKDSKTTMSKVVAISLNGNRIFAWPNPAKDNLNIKLSGNNNEAVISIYNMTGKLLMTQKTNAASAIANINVASLSAGTYVIKVTEGGNVSKQVFIKQ